MKNRHSSNAGRPLLTLAVLLCITAVSAQTSKITGTVSASDCPPDVMTFAPCGVMPVAGCTVIVDPISNGPEIMIYPPPNRVTAITDDKGFFSVTLKNPLARGDKYHVSIEAPGFAGYRNTFTATGSATNRIAIELSYPQKPVTGFTSNVNGTVFASKCPPNSMMGMPCVIEPVPQCTITFYFSAPTTYRESDGSVGGFTTSYASRRAVTDSKGRFSLDVIPALPFGTMVTALIEKSGYQPIKNSLVLRQDTVYGWDQYLSESVVTIPRERGYAKLQGTVSWSDPGSMLTVMSPVANCTVYVYPTTILSSPYDKPIISSSSASEGNGSTIYPEPIARYSYSAITDSRGSFSIDSIVTYGLDFLVTTFKAGKGTAEEMVQLTPGEMASVDLYLKPFPEPLPIIGKGSISGSVLQKACRSGVSECLLEPVAGCTVLVSASFAPMRETYREMTMPSSIEKVYSAVTDSRGYFTIKDIDMRTKEYGVVLMAQKGNLFGSTYATLVLDENVKVEIVLDQASYVIAEKPGSSAPDTVRTAEAAFYADKRAEAVTSSVRPIGGKNNDNRPTIHRVGLSVVGLVLSEEQTVTVAYYGVNGRLLRHESQLLLKGNHHLDLGKVKYGQPVVVRVSGSRGLSHTLRLMPEGSR